MLDRFASRIAHNDPRVRQEAMTLMVALLQRQLGTEHKRVFLIQNYELVKTALNLLKNETVPRLMLVEHQLIVSSILREPAKMEDAAFCELIKSGQYSDGTVDFTFYDQFLQYGGLDIYEEARLRFQKTPQIQNVLNHFMECLFSREAQE